jgi:hypothetical protein
MKGKTVMQCIEVEKWIEQFVDDELGFLFKKDVEAHINECRSCERILTSIQKVRGLIKHSLPVISPSAQMDARVFEAFNRKHKKNKANLPLLWLNKIFGGLAVSKPAFALAMILFAFGLGLAFQVGRITATDVNLTVDLRELSSPPSKIALPVELKEESQIQAEETPVIRERVVTRVVYVDSQKNKEIKVKSRQAKSGSDKFTLNNTIAEDGYLTQANLSGFKPTSEIKTTIIKGDKTDAK